MRSLCRLFYLIVPLALVLCGHAQTTLDRPTCQKLDSSFARTFDLVAATAAFLGAVVLPIALPVLLGSRWWWLTRHHFRWVVLLTVVSVVFLTGWFLLPAAVIFKVVSADTGLWLYGLDPRYLSCSEQNFKTAGFLFGLIPTGRELTIRNWIFMPLTFTVFLIFFSLIYWSLRMALKLRLGSSS